MKGFEEVKHLCQNSVRLWYAGFKPSQYGFYKDEFVKDIEQKRYTEIVRRGVKSLFEGS